MCFNVGVPKFSLCHGKGADAPWGRQRPRTKAPYLHGKKKRKTCRNDLIHYTWSFLNAGTAHGTRHTGPRRACDGAVWASPRAPNFLGMLGKLRCAHPLLFGQGSGAPSRRACLEIYAGPPTLYGGRLLSLFKKENLAEMLLDDDEACSLSLSRRVCV